MIGAEQGITPSGLVYLFGEQFVEPAKMIGETLLVSGVKVKSRELAEMLYGVALLALNAEGCVRLDLAQRKRFLGLGQAQMVAVTPLGRPAPGGLEAAIVACLTPDPTRNGVADVLSRHIGQDMADPWGHITAAVKVDLAARGFLREQREARQGLGRVFGDKVTLIPAPERIATVTNLPGMIRGLLANMQARQPQLAGQLWKDMRQGFQSRVEQQDSSSDD
ncbi:MAG TPA: hypothetical protein PLJ35_21390 [Anaerolineae bacterium]|nr:hypothetical protein [Anaerolineae bacterium]HPL29202.1 hypothetical protein [Anaerolineae bacterium]